MAKNKGEVEGHIGHSSCPKSESEPGQAFLPSGMRVLTLASASPYELIFDTAYTRTMYSPMSSGAVHVTLAAPVLSTYQDVN